MIGRTPTRTSRASSTSTRWPSKNGLKMRIHARRVAVIATVGGGCGDADEGGAPGEEYEISNAVLREPDVVSVQVGSCNAVQRETVIEEDTEAVPGSVAAQRAWRGVLVAIGVQALRMIRPSLARSPLTVGLSRWVVISTSPVRSSG